MTHLAELEAAARFLRGELNAALNAVLEEDYDGLQLFLRRAALSAGLIEAGARKAQEGMMRQAEFDVEAA